MDIPPPWSTAGLPAPVPDQALTPAHFKVRISTRHSELEKHRGSPRPPPCQAKNATVNNNVQQSHLTLGIHARLLREDPKQPQYIIPKWGQLDQVHWPRMPERADSLWLDPGL